MHCQNLSSALLLLVVFSSFAASINFRGATFNWKVTEQTSTGTEILLTYRVGWRISLGTNNLCNDFIISNRTIVTGDSPISCSNCSKFTENSMSYYCTDFSNSQDWVTGSRTIKSYGVNYSMVTFASSGCCWSYDLAIESDGSINVVGQVNLMGTTFQGKLNSSPVSGIPLLLFFVQKCSQTVSLRARDPDGDYFYCRWAVGTKECGGVCKHPEEITLLGDTCQLQYAGQRALGLYALAIVIVEPFPQYSQVSRSSVPLQFVVRVVATSHACNQRPIFSEKTKPDGWILQLEQSSLFQQRIYMYTFIDTDPITDFVAASPVGLIQSSIQAVAKRKTEFFLDVTWSPSGDQTGRHDFCFTALTKSGLSTELRCFYLEITDVDECSGNHPCQQECVNVAGSFRCSCRNGYEALNGTHCRDVDECASGSSVCHANAGCMNTAGSYVCSCKAGFSGDGFTSCQDVDECSGNHPCQQECVNVAGSFRCSCRNGYEALNGTHCRDVDECASGSSVCHANAGCMNTAGSYVCSCKAGFSGDGFTSCQDVDECSGNHPCQQGCVNVAGSFRCSCNSGFEALNGTHCRDVDECASGSSVCHANAGCMNTAGSYVCSCKAGFSGDGFTSCQDVDECSGNHLCHQECVNVAGSSRCSCNSGYEALNGTHCRDVDECASGSSVCHANAGCMNTAGSYVCSCKAGFSGDGFTSCQDVDECSGNHPCQQGCVNVAGSFRCSCNSGYEALNGTHCRDVDECASGSSVCHANAGCMNTAGSYVCSCKAGFSGDGFTSCQGYQSTSLVTLLAFLTVSNIQLLPDRQDTASEAYMELGERVVRELLGVLSNYSHANRSAEVASKQQVFSGVAFVLRLETLFTSEFNATHYHQIVISDISRAAEGNAFPSIQVVPETVLVRSVAYCLEEKTGQTSSKGTFYWPQTKPGGNASQRCPFGPIAVSGTRKCIIGRYSDALWEKPDVSACSYGIQRTQDLFKLSKTPLNASTVVNISRSTEELTRNTKELTADDTTLASSIINDIVQSNLLSRSVEKNLLKAVSSIMQSNTSSLDAAQQESKSLSKIVKSMASLAAAISLSSQVGAKEVLVGDQVAIHVNRLSRESFTESLFTVKKTTAEKFVPNDFHFPDSVGSLDNVSLLVRFPSDFLKSAVSAGTQKPRLGFVVYNEDSLFPTFLKVASGGAVKAKDVQTTGMVVGIQVEDQDNVNLASPIELTLQNRKKLSPANLRCVFWNFTLLDGVGGWSEKGCSKTASSAESITCACSHLTNFAVLFDPYAGSSPISHAGHKKALSIISTIGAAISIAALAFAIVTYTLFRQLRGNVQTKITLQLCVALLLTLAVFLGAVDRGLTGLPCRIWAIILHYLLLATFCWQFVNAFHLHRIFVVVIGAHIPKFMIKATFFAWVVPLPLVGAAAAVFWMDYNADQTCIVQGYAAYGFLFGPVLFLLLANYILFALVIKSLRQRHKVKDQKESEHRVELKLSLMACSLLGLTWIFGAFAVAGAQLVFQYLFCIFNSFQGLFLCYFQLGRSVMVRQMWVALLSGKGRNYRLPSSQLSNRAASKRKKPSTAQLPEREKSVVLQNPYPTSSKTLPTIISSESHL